MDELEHTIVIVGAGPTGLALGAELKRLGISSFILDRLEAGANTSRAAVVHARTLEVLEPLGVTTELLQEGIIVPIFRVRDRNRILVSVNFKDLDTKYPFALMCPQNRTEAILLRRFESLGGAVQRPCEVVAVHPGENKVQVQFDSRQLQPLRVVVVVVGGISKRQKHASGPGGVELQFPDHTVTDVVLEVGVQPQF
jgi:2-polyprenyl-6-methoxyphenol hydroxylase-like FAD-dependent oxidoreductase